MPSQGAMQVRCGGCSAAMRHWHMARAELPSMPTRPLHHSLPGQPLDQVVSVAALLRDPQVHVALGVAHPAVVVVGDGVALVAPVLRVRSLELGVGRVRAVRHAQGLPDHVRGVGRRALAEEAPRNDDGDISLVRRDGRCRSRSWCRRASARRRPARRSPRCPRRRCAG